MNNAGMGGNRALRKRSVVIAGHRTSLSIEQDFWDALRGIAAARRLSLNRLIEEIDRGRPADGGNLSSAVRVYVLQQALRRSAACPG